MSSSQQIPLIAVPGRIGPAADNVRGEAFAVGQRYMNAIARAGGQGVMLPPTGVDLGRTIDAMRHLHGVVLHGGGDIDPRRYGEEPAADQLYGIVEQHDDLEFTVLAAAIELDLPVLAICRGHQVLNVHCGGTLHQDLGTEAHWHTYHSVTVEPGSRLAKAGLGPGVVTDCHSVHHQAIRDLGAGLTVTARSDDDVIEAVELDGAHWVVGVQWHPEDTAADDPVQQALFDALVHQACAAMAAV